MKVGVNLLNFGPGAEPAALARSARLIEALGYHALLISDHVAITPDVAAIYPAPFYDPFLTLAWLASQTRVLELGTTVIILPYRHPLQVARLAANLDQLSGGRFILGVGAGWAAQEFAALGVPFAARGALTDDALDVIRASWRTDLLSHHSPFVAADAVATAPRPLRAPQPPIWVGGNGAVGRRAPCGIVAPGTRSASASTGCARSATHVSRPPRGTPTCRLRRSAHASSWPSAPRRWTTPAGWPDRVRSRRCGRILAELEVLGAEYVVLDTYQGHPDTLPGHERDWTMLATLAEQVLDLSHETVRG